MMYCNCFIPGKPLDQMEINATFRALKIKILYEFFDNKNTLEFKELLQPRPGKFFIKV